MKSTGTRSSNEMQRHDLDKDNGPSDECAKTTYYKYQLIWFWFLSTWWRHQMEAFDVFFDLRLKRRLHKQSRGWYLRHNRAHYDVIVVNVIVINWVFLSLWEFNGLTVNPGVVWESTPVNGRSRSNSFLGGIYWVLEQFLCILTHCDAHKCYWVRSSLTQSMACRLLDAKPFPEPILTINLTWDYDSSLRFDHQ